MAELKTKQTDANVDEFINSCADNEQKRKDSFEILSENTRKVDKINPLIS